MWLTITLSGYLLNAVSLVINKALLSRDIPQPTAYAFMTALLGMLVMVVLPFGVTWLPAKLLWLSLAAGAFFLLAIWAMFTALRYGEASKIAPFIGGIQPLLVFLIAAFFLGEVLAENALWGFLLVVLGGLVISLHRSAYPHHAFWFAFLSTAAFAFSYTITKAVFNEASFLDGLFWTRLGAFLPALPLLLSPTTRRLLSQMIKPKKAKSGGFFLIGQITGAASFILINYAFSIHSVTLVNALQGIQYVFLFLLVVPLSYFYPKLWHENLHQGALLQKFLAVILISSGLYFLA